MHNTPTEGLPWGHIIPLVLTTTLPRPLLIGFPPPRGRRSPEWFLVTEHKARARDRTGSRTFLNPEPCLFHNTPQIVSLLWKTSPRLLDWSLPSPQRFSDGLGRTQISQPTCLGAGSRPSTGPLAIKSDVQKSCKDRIGCSRMTCTWCSHCQHFTFLWSTCQDEEAIINSISDLHLDFSSSPIIVFFLLKDRSVDLVVMSPSSPWFCDSFSGLSLFFMQNSIFSKDFK